MKKIDTTFPKMLWVLAFVFLLSATSFSQKAVRVLFSAELHSALDSLTISYDSPFGFIVLPVEIEGHAYRFIFDTGAQSTLISEQLAQKLHLAEKGEAKVVDAQKVSKKLSYGKIPSLNIGKLTYAGVGTIVNDFSRNKIFSCMRIDGVLGMNVLKLSNWQINYDSHSLTAFPLERANAFAQGSLLPFITIGGVPYVDLLVNGVTQRFMIDLGNNSEEVSIAANMQLPKVDHILLGKSSLGLFGEAASDTIQEARAELHGNSDFVLEDVQISQSSNSDANIGTGFLAKRFSQLFIDFKANKLFLKKRETVTPDYIYPFSLIMSESGYMLISAVEIGNTEFKIGDVVMGINDFTFQQMGSCAFSEKFWMEKKKGISTISISEDGQLKIHTLNSVKP